MVGCPVRDNSDFFVEALLPKLQNPSPFVRKQALSLLRLVYQSHDHKSQFIRDFDLYPVVRPLMQDQGQIVIFDLAKKLIEDFDKHRR
jgi:hypothetical protein